MMNAEIAIRTENLTRHFDTVRAVDQLAMEVPKGIIFGFLGPNGSGKTTTIRLLLGLLEPTGGTASVLGYDIRQAHDEIRARCGALLEHHGLYERLSAQENLEFYARIWRLPAQERASRARELLDKMGLWERRAEKVGKWSRGMKQKLAVARALLHRPELVFLDEPTAGLDPMAAATLRDDLYHLAHDEGITIFLTTHNLPEAEKLCTLVGVVRNGRLIACDSPQALRARKKGQDIKIFGEGFTPQVFEELRQLPGVSSVKLENGHLHLHFKEPVQTAPLITRLVQAGVAVEEVRKDAEDLEETFLTLMEEEVEK